MANDYCRPLLPRGHRDEKHDLPCSDDGVPCNDSSRNGRTRGEVAYAESTSMLMLNTGAQIITVTGCRTQMVNRATARTASS